MLRPFNIEPDDWKIAHKKLDAASDGTKLPYSTAQWLDVEDNLITYNSRGSSNSSRDFSWNTLISFIKIEGVIYGLANGKLENAIIGKGSYGKVKFAKTEDNTVWAIKIENNTHFHTREIETLRDLVLLEGYAKLARDLSYPSYIPSKKEKHYIVMPYLGLSLDQLLKNKLSESERLNYAIKLCYEVFTLHNGSYSQTTTPYAHSDIKPANITLDDKKQIRLVDFGRAIPNPNGIKYERFGTENYNVPANKDGFVLLTRAQCDMIALKRTLYMPPTIHTSTGFQRLYPDDTKSILSYNFIAQHKLMPFLDTGSKSADAPYDFYHDRTTPIALCAILMAISDQLRISPADIHSNERLALIIASHTLNKEPSNELYKLLENSIASKIFAVLAQISRLSKFQDYLKNESFKADIQDIESHTIIRALIQLKESGLDVDTTLVKTSEIVSKAILILFASQLSQHISAVMNDLQLAQLICDLEAAGFECFYRSMLSNPREQTLLRIALQSEETKLALAVLSIKNNYSIKNLELICANNTIAKALLILFKNHLCRFNGAALDSVEAAEAIVACKHIGLFSENGNADHFNFYLSDFEFRHFFNAAAHPNIARAIFLLKFHSLDKFYSYAIDSLPFSEALLKLNALNAFNLPEKKTRLSNIFFIMKENNLSPHIAMVLHKIANHPIYRSLLKNNHSPSELLVLIRKAIADPSYSQPFNSASESAIRIQHNHFKPVEQTPNQAVNPQTSATPFSPFSPN